jgi:hypothetical protein
MSVPTLLEKHYDLVKGQSFLHLCLLESHNSCSQEADAGKGIISDQMLLNKLNQLPSIIRSYGLKSFCDDFAETQTLDVATQLTSSGVRSLDVRVCDDGYGGLYIHHTFFIYSLPVLLDVVKTFLIAHPKELLQIKFKWTDTQNDSDLSERIGTTLTNSGVIGMTVTRDIRYDKIEALVASNKRLFIFVDSIGSRSPPLPEWAVGRLSEYLDKYIDTNTASVKIAILKSQLSTLPAGHNLYTLNYTLTPDTDDYTKTGVVTCCGLRKVSKGSRALRDINDTLPEIKKAFPIGTFQERINSVSMDFVPAGVEFAEWLILKA